MRAQGARQRPPVTRPPAAAGPIGDRRDRLIQATLLQKPAASGSIPAAKARRRRPAARRIGSQVRVTTVPSPRAKKRTHTEGRFTKASTSASTTAERLYTFWRHRPQKRTAS